MIYDNVHYLMFGNHLDCYWIFIRNNIS